MHLTGKTFGRLLVLNKTERTVGCSRFYYWLCRCECGVEKEISYSSLVNGLTKSCGCLKREVSSQDRKHGYAKFKNKKPEYFAWQNMKDRCYNIKSPVYKDYGGRGIFVCEKWLNSFVSFISDMGEKPTTKHSLERVDNNKGYSPSNCIWATRKQQTANQRRSVRLTINGETLLQEEWAEKLNVRSSYFSYHLKKNKTADEIYNRIITGKALNPHSPIYNYTNKSRVR